MRRHPQSEDSKASPRLSAILISFNGTYSLVQRTISHLLRQTVAGQIELIIVAPDKRDILKNAANFAPFYDFQCIELENIGSIAEAYAAGVRKATAGIVVLCEDHCFPAPDWAAYLLEAHEADWAAVGPAFRNGNPGNTMSWASLFLDYSEWVHPVASGVRSHIPGHNSSYKRSILLEYGNRLEAMLEAESLLHWDLRKKGHQVYLESRAKTDHLNFEDFPAWIEMIFYASRRFAACRSEGWYWSKRLLYAGASPLIPLVRWVRIIREARKPGRFSGNFFLLYTIILSGLCVWGFGELMGYAFGPGNSLAKITPFEFDRLQYMKSKLTTQS